MIQQRKRAFVFDVVPARAIAQYLRALRGVIAFNPFYIAVCEGEIRTAKMNLRRRISRFEGF